MISRVTRGLSRALTDDDEGRRTHLADAFAYLLLVLSVIIAYFSQDEFDQTWQTRPVLLATTALTLAWIWWWTTAHRGWRSSVRRMRSYYVGRTVLAALLSLVNPFCAIFAWVGFLDVDVFRARGRHVAVAATALILAGSQSGGLPPENPSQGVLVVVLFGINLGLASVMLHVHERMQRLGAERAATIAQLEEANTRLGEALAENAALQEQLLVQAREAGVLDERQRLAREIHDTIAQGLAGIVTQLQAADESRDAATAHEHRGRAADLARVSLEEARRSVHDLSPGELVTDSLPSALRRLVAQWSLAAGVGARLEVTGSWRRVHEEVEATLLRVAQEGLANVAKHADAELVVVTLSAMEQEVTLDVHDDGQGFVPARLPGSGPAGGFGIAGMRRRAERLAGELVVESERGRGTAVSVRLPALVREAGRAADQDPGAELQTLPLVQRRSA